MCASNGRMYKIKTLFYVNAGKGDSDLLAQEHTIWKLILGEKIDDYKASGIKKALKNRVEKFSALLLKNIQETAERFAKQVDEMKQGDFNSELAKKPEIENSFTDQCRKRSFKMCCQYHHCKFVKRKYGKDSISRWRYKVLLIGNRKLEHVNTLIG